MNQRLPAVIAAAFFVLALGGVLWLGASTAEEPAHGDQLFVVTTMYPLADFAKNVGGDRVFVTNVVPAGAEPHDYEPSPGDVAMVERADVLAYIGSGLDTWAADLAPHVTARGGQTVGADQIVEIVNQDPHVWLDPVAAVSLVNALRDAFITADPDHAQDYRNNATAYVAKLQAVDADYAAGLADCQLNDIIVAHDAMGYVARRYDFNAHAISGFSPEAEPSVRDLATLANTARRLKIDTVFFETLVSPQLADTLATEIGAKTAVLNPLEGLSDEELAAGDDYVSVMRQNLGALKAAMLCQ